MSSERRWMESLVSCIPDALALLHEDGRIVWANSELSAMIGVSEALKGRHARDLFERWEALQSLLSSLPDRDRIATSVMLRLPGGAARPVQLHAARCVEGTGATWSIHLRDSTEADELRRRLGDRERSQSFLLGNTSDLIVRTDAMLQVLWVNDAAAELFQSGGLLGEVIDDGSRAALEACLHPDAAERFDLVLHAADGHRPAFFLKGAGRRLVGEAGEVLGLSLLLRDDSHGMRLARFVQAHGLSPREEEVIEYVAKGYSNLNIAAILGLSESGVKFHIRNVFQRAKVATRTELMAVIMGE
jgi:PAS domain S-box-containing protein